MRKADGMISGCIFDLDGTLVNSTYALQRSTNLTLEEFGLSPISIEDIKKIVGDGYKKQMERALLLHGEGAMRFYEASLPLYMEYFSKNCLYRLDAYDGILEMLGELKKRGIRTAVFSNKPHAQTMENVSYVFGKEMFDQILGQKEGTPVKPNPAGVFQILDHCNLRPEECLYFGDTNTDMQTGKAAGIKTVGVLWGFRGKEELEQYSPDYLISHPLQAVRIIEELEQYENKK